MAQSVEIGFWADTAWQRAACAKLGWNAPSRLAVERLPQHRRAELGVLASRGRSVIGFLACAALKIDGEPRLRVYNEARQLPVTDALRSGRHTTDARLYVALDFPEAVIDHDVPDGMSGLPFELYAALHAVDDSDIQVVEGLEAARVPVAHPDVVGRFTVFHT